MGTKHNDTKQIANRVNIYSEESSLYICVCVCVIVITECHMRQGGSLCGIIVGRIDLTSF